MGEFIKAFRIYVILTLLTGLCYPLLVTGIAQLIFPYQANGSLIVQDNKTIGSELLGQQFKDPKYFWSRPSATNPAYNASASSGSNLGPTNPKLKESKDELFKKLNESIGKEHTAPEDLCTSSGSGLDPHISPEAAECQVERVSRLRSLSSDIVANLVKKHTKSPQLGILGKPVVNVLTLNIDLDRDRNNQK